jgi:hypothetical protein
LEWLEQVLQLMLANLHLGLILPTKKTEKFSVFFQNFLFYVNSNRNLKLGSYEKFTEKKLQNSCQLSAPKNLCRIFFCFTGKNWLFEISLHIQKTGFFFVFADGRIKPWETCQNGRGLLALLTLKDTLADPTHFYQIL